MSKIHHIPNRNIVVSLTQVKVAFDNPTLLAFLKNVLLEKLDS